MSAYRLPTGKAGQDRLDTHRLATPHRCPDWDSIWSDVDGDPEVAALPVFIEKHNTGYDGVLHRWLFSVDGKDGQPVKFMANPFPNDITVRV